MSEAYRAAVTTGLRSRSWLGLRSPLARRPCATGAVDESASVGAWGRGGTLSRASKKGRQRPGAVRSMSGGNGAPDCPPHHQPLTIKAPGRVKPGDVV